MACRLNQAATSRRRIERVRLKTMTPAAITALASTIAPTGMEKPAVATVAQSMHTVAASNDTWLSEPQRLQHVDITFLLVNCM